MNDETEADETEADETEGMTERNTNPGVRLPAEQPVACQPSLDELYKYLDGFMDEQRQATVQSHLAHCPPCAQLYMFQAGFRHLIGKRCRSELPADLPTRIFRTINDQG